MVVIPKVEHLDEVLAHFRKWEIRADVIGVVTDDGMATIREGDEVVARIPIGVLVDAPPYPPEGVRPSGLDALQGGDVAAYPACEAHTEGALRVRAPRDTASLWGYT